jgi:hypothetical protein
VQTFLPYPDLRASCQVLDDRRLGKQRVETFQILRALTWASYAWKSHPAVRMWRGFVPGLVLYGVESCREWSRRGYGDAVLPQLLAWTGGSVPVDPELPPWFGAEDLHRSHRSNLLRKDPAFYGELFDEPDDLPYLWPPDVFPHWPLREGLGLVPHPWQAAAVQGVGHGRDVLLVARPGHGGSTAGLLAGLAVPGRTLVLAPPLGPPAGPVPDVPLLPVRTVPPGAPAEAIARAPGPEDLLAMAAENAPPRFLFRLPGVAAPDDVGLVVLDGAAVPVRSAVPVRAGVPVLAVVARTDDPAGTARQLGLRDPLHVGGGWDVAADLAETALPPRAAVAGAQRPVLVVTSDRPAADRLLTRLRADGLRVRTWAPTMRASLAAESVAAWRSRRLDALLVPSGPLPPLGRVRPRTLLGLHGPDAEDWRQLVEVTAPDLAVLPPAPWAQGAGCLREALLRPFGEPVAAPCGRCDRCVRPPD